MMKMNFTSQARAAISLAKKTAVDRNHSYIGTEHLLVGLLREKKGTAGIVLREFGVEETKLLGLIDRLIAPESPADTMLKPELTVHARQVLDGAVAEADRDGLRQAGTEHILISILKINSCVGARLLYTMGVQLPRLYDALLRAEGIPENSRKERAAELSGSRNASVTETPFLDQFSRDLTEMARAHRLDPVVGRDREIERIIEILSRRKKNNPCLVGEPGVGKTAIVEGLAQRIVSGQVPESVSGKRLIMLDLTGMVAGTKYRGEFEERIRRIIQEVTESRSVLLFIDEIHTIIGAGGAEGALDASNILKPSLARGELQLIGATTLEEYRKHIEKDAALERRIQPVTVEEPGEAESLEILKGLRPYYERHHKVTITDGALEAAVRMSARYINDRFLPDKAVDLIDEASSRVCLKRFSGKKEPEQTEREMQSLIAGREDALRRGDLEEARRLNHEQHDLQEKLAKEETRRNSARKRADQTVTEEDIAETVSSWTKIPLTRLRQSESRRLANLEKVLHKRVVGQDEAVCAVAQAVRRGRAGLKDPNRPIGSFLFLGPTGVGKTELSKALAEAVFGTEDAMIRVDMSEYMEKHSVSKMIGSPPGYVGYEEGGQLSEKIRRHPYSVVLFDEIEKAHPDVFNILLQVLDDGHITDAQGRKVSFRECIIIMTSNTGAEQIVQPKKLGFLSVDDEKQDYQRMKGLVMDELSRNFRPEFLNRIDETIVFHALTKEDMKSIVNILLEELKRRCKEQLNLKLSVTGSARELLITKSYDSKYGARPLKRAIQKQIEDPLAEEILLGKVHRDGAVTVSEKEGRLLFRERK